jgi:hypothetical protein
MMNTLEFIDEFTKKNLDFPEVFNKFLRLFSQNFDINTIISNTDLTLQIFIYEDCFQFSITKDYATLVKISLGKSYLDSAEFNNLSNTPHFDINCIDYQIENDVILKSAYFLNYLLTYPSITTISISDSTKNYISFKELLYKTLDTGIYATTLEIDYDVELIFNNLDLSKITNIYIDHLYLSIFIKDRDKFKSLTHLKILLSRSITVDIVKLILDCDVINNTIVTCEFEVMDILSKSSIEFDARYNNDIYTISFINDQWERLDKGLK